MRLSDKIKLWKQYSKMADLPIIARRKFFNNCFDGALTSAGIISGFLILFILNPSFIRSSTILITGFATASAIGISGLWGAFLSEDAERKKKIIDLKKVMAVIEEKSDENQKIYKNKEKKEGKTIIQKAENFATWIASIVDGGAPVLGATLPLIPFFFAINLTILHFIFSYIILIGLLIYLGNFLGKISGGGRVKYALHLVLAGIVTLIVSILLGSLTS